MTKQTLSDDRIDEIETRAAHLYEYACQDGGEGDTLAGTDVPALVAEIRRLRAELAREERLHTSTIDGRDRAQDAADKLAYAVAPEEVIGEHSSMNCPWENALDLITPMADVDKLRAELAAGRTLTESQHNAAWHAIEGAAGEDMADPGTVLNAVLYALGIAPPAASAVSGAADSRQP